jgi:hypothetical protein
MNTEIFKIIAMLLLTSTRYSIKKYISKVSHLWRNAIGFAPTWLKSAFQMDGVNLKRDETS